MAKVRPAGKRKAVSVGAEFQKYRGAIPCLFVIVGGMVGLFLLLYFSMKSAGR
jgi:hypothetical protein